MSWDEALAGAVARTMLAQDARWIADAMLSARDKSGWLVPLLLGHAARIVHEGSQLVRSTSSHVGVPELAQLLHREHEDTIARSRHAGKFLDDSKKSFDDQRDNLTSFWGKHQQEFLGNAIWFARWLESDVGITFARRRRMLGTTITSHFRTGLDSSVPINEAGQLLHSVAVGLGQALAVFAAIAGDESPPQATIDVNAIGPLRSIDRRLVRYASNMYDPGMDPATKLLLMMVEGEINTAIEIIDLGRNGHPDATFRARLISLYHSLRAIDEILRTGSPHDPLPAKHVRALLSDADVRWFLEDPGARRLRNRCTHYEIWDRTIQLDPSLPFSGMVERLAAGATFDELDARVRFVAEQVSDSLHVWRR